MKTGVYSIINLINGKMIIGSGILKKRQYSHFYFLKKGNHDNPYLQNAVNKDNIENFVFEILEYCKHSECIENETFWVNFLDTKNPDKGYNINDPENIRLGIKHTEETKEKLRHKAIGRKASLEAKLNMRASAKNKPPFSEETRRKIGLAHKGKTISDEAKQKMSLARVGQKVSKETIEKREATKKLNKCTYVAVLQYDEEGNFIKEFCSMTEAVKELGLKNAGSISRAIISNTKAGGFKWKKKI